MEKHRRRQPSPEPLPLRDEDQAETEDQAPEEDEDARRKKRQRQKERRQALAPVGQGLLFNYIGGCLFMGGVALASLGLGLVLVSVVIGLFAGSLEMEQRLASVLSVSALCAFIVSIGLIFLGMIVDAPCPLFCLRVPDGPARVLILGVIVLRMLTVLALGWFVVVAVTGPLEKRTQLALSVLTILILQLLAWWAWMAFLHRLCLQAGSPSLAREATSVFVGAFTTALGCLMAIFVFVFFISLLIMAMLRPMPWGMLLGAGMAGIAATIRIILMVGDSSLVDALLWPTGIFYVIRYLNFISAVRAEAS
jgi:hypothetical protein